MTISDVSQSTPKLVLEKYFLGKTYASGIFEDRFGTVRRQFTVDIEGTFDQNVLYLVEDFVFNDGERETTEIHGSVPAGKHNMCSASKHRNTLRILVLAGKQHSVSISS